ncbi:MAG: Rha family transcriptional regulator, partial [Desulfarculales bacterium]|nr:Rha family transcriptional regulator [Desulfarculales bacterium]
MSNQNLPIPVTHPSLRSVPPEITLELSPSGSCFVASSRQIAVHFEKKHKNVLQQIQDLRRLCPYEFNELNFQPVNYQDEKGESRPEYLLTRDGFCLLAMGFTGAKALKFKLAYIETFNALEARAATSSATPAALLETLLDLGPQRLAQLKKLVSCRRRSFTRQETALVMGLHP